MVILNALAGRPIPVYGRGENVRDWLYVEDHADALLLVLEQGAVGRSYNIGGHNERRDIDLGRDDADLSDPEICVGAIRDHDPEAVINAAACTAVDRAEEKETLATVINGAAPAAMARACAEAGVPLVHISTDYVFDGAGSEPRRPDEPVAPLGVYGRSKLVGEEGVRGAGGAHAILRASWAGFARAICGLSSTGWPSRRTERRTLPARLRRDPAARRLYRLQPPDTPVPEGWRSDSCGALLAHARRKLKEVFDRDGSEIVGEGLRRIAEFYAVEADIRGCSPDQRLSTRQARTAPFVAAFGDWLQQQRLRVSAKSRLGEKLAYIHRHWDGLQTFLQNGCVEIDSNNVENLIRPIALSRKNALFAGHDEGGRIWGRNASLIETAKVNGVEPLPT